MPTGPKAFWNNRVCVGSDPVAGTHNKKRLWRTSDARQIAAGLSNSATWRDTFRPAVLDSLRLWWGVSCYFVDRPRPPSMGAVKPGTHAEWLRPTLPWASGGHTPRFSLASARLVLLPGTWGAPYKAATKRVWVIVLRLAPILKRLSGIPEK